MGSTITRRSAEHGLAAGEGLLDAEGNPARAAPRLLEWRPARPAFSHGRAPGGSPQGGLDGGPTDALALAPRGLEDLGPASVLRVRGPEREPWIQGVQTLDVQTIAADGGARTLFLNARGRVLASATLWRRQPPEGSELLLHVPPLQLEALRAHLDGLLIMEDAELSVAPGFRALRLHPGGLEPGGSVRALLDGLRAEPGVASGARDPRSPDEVPQPASSPTTPTSREEGMALAPAELLELRGAETPLGLELLLPDAQARALLERIPLRPEPAAAHAWRVAMGVPASGADFDDSSTPLEAGLDAQIAFGKGCYVGQEVIAMATFRGRVPWNLVRLEVEGPPPAPGTPLDTERGGKGRVTSSAAWGERAVLLGLVHRERIEPGSRLLLADGRAATVLGLPFDSRPNAGQK